MTDLTYTPAVAAATAPLYAKVKTRHPGDRVAGVRAVRSRRSTR